MNNDAANIKAMSSEKNNENLYLKQEVSEEVKCFCVSDIASSLVCCLDQSSLCGELNE